MNLIAVVLFACALAIGKGSMTDDEKAIRELFKNYIAGWNSDNIDAVMPHFATEFTMIGPYIGKIKRTAKSDEVEKALIKEKIKEKVLIWNGKCEMRALIPAPPVYYSPIRCSKNTETDVWQNAEVDFVYTKEDGKWKIEYVLWYEGNKKPRLAQRKSKNQSKI